MIRSRLQAGLSSYARTFEDSDVVLLEPRRDDYRMFFTNVFSFSSRRDVCEHAYRATRHELWERREELTPVFARHGLTLRTDLLEDPDRSLWDDVELPDGRPRMLSTLDRALDRLERYVDAVEPS